MFTEHLHLAKKNSSYKSNNNKNKHNSNYSVEVKELIRKKRKAHRKWQKTRDPKLN